MNWLGKVFVVVILIMSLVFMGLSMAVYATHKNWKQVSDGLNKQAHDGEGRERQLESPTHNRRVEELEREKTRPSSRRSSSKPRRSRWTNATSKSKPSWTGSGKISAITLRPWLRRRPSTRH